MKKIKNIIVIVAFTLSFLYLLANIGKIYIPPFKWDIDLTTQVSSAHLKDDRMAVLAMRKVYVTDSLGRVESIFDINDANLFDYFAYDVRTDGDSVYIFGVDKYDNSSFLSTEKIVKTDKNGKLESTVFQKDYEKWDRVFYVSELDFAVDNGYLYYLCDDGGKENLYKVPIDGSDIDPEIVASFTIPMEAVDGKISLSDNKLYVADISGEVFCFDMETNTLEATYAAEEISLVDNELLSKAEHLTVDTFLFVKVLLYYLSILIIGLGIVFSLILFFKSGSFSKHKMIWIITVFLIVSVYILTKQLVYSKQEATASTLSSIANMTIMDLEKYYEGDTAFSDFDEYISRPGMMDKIDKCREYIDDVCEREGGSAPIYLMIYAVDKNQNPYVIGTTAHDRYISYHDEISAEEEEKNIISLSEYAFQAEDEISDNWEGNSYAYKDAMGLYYIEERYLFDEAGKIDFILEVGVDGESIQSESIKSALMIVLNLSAILAFLWVLFDFVSRYKVDITEYINSKDKRKIENRIKLGGVYFTILSAVFHLDYFLLVMVVADIADGAGALSIAGLLAIPFTAARVGCWIGSLSASTIINFLGERKTGIIASSITVISYILLAYACVIKSIYLLTFAKFFVGMCLDSFLPTLAEGLPYEIEDEAEKENQISKIKDGEMGAVIIGLMFSGLLAQNVGYASIYIVGAIGAAIMLFMTPLVLRTPKEEEADEKEDAPNGWLAFVKPKVLLYLIAIVTIGVFMHGYEEYIFPLLSENIGLSDMELSNMGILANVAAFIGIEQFLPEKKYKNMTLMAGAFLICGIAIGLLTLNSTILMAFVVLIVLNLVGRSIDNYQVLELTKISDGYGYDAKDVQENFYAVSDGINVLQAPVIGALCSVSMVLCYVVLGAVTAIVPGCYSLYSDLQQRTQKS